MNSTRFGVKRCDCGVNIAEHMKMCMSCEIKLLRTQRDELVDALESVKDLLKNTTCTSGVCMCGDSMNNHYIKSNHQLTDSGEYYQGSYLESITALLTKIKENET